MKTAQKQVRRQARARRTHAKVAGSGAPRLLVFKSNTAIYAKIIDNVTGNTLFEASNLSLKLKTTGMKAAVEVGKGVADLAKKKKIEKVVFDRNGFPYIGKIKALADAAREAGLKF